MRMNQNEEPAMMKQSGIRVHSGQQQMKQSQQQNQQHQVDMKISLQKARDFTTLEQVSNVALVGLINQLSSLSCQSERLFNELCQQCEQFNERTTLLTKRVTSLRNIVDKLDCKKVEPKPSLGELMGDLFLLTTSSSNDLLKWTTTTNNHNDTIGTNNKLENNNEEEEDHEELVRRIVTNAKIDDAITEKRRLCRQAALDTWLQDFKSSQAYHPFNGSDDVISNGDDSNRLLHNITIIDYDCNSIYDKLKHHHPTLNMFNFKNRSRTVKELYNLAERDTQAHINKLIRQHIALIRSSSNSQCTTSSSIRSSSPSSVSTIVRSASNSTTGGYNRPSSVDYYSSSQLPARSKSARFLRPRFTLPITSRQPVVVLVDSPTTTDKQKLSNGHHQMPHETHDDPSSSNQINSSTITKQPMVKSNSYCLTNKLNYCLNNNNNLSHNIEETDGTTTSGSNGAKPAVEAGKQCDINDLKQKQLMTETTCDNGQDNDAEKISTISSCVDNHHHHHHHHHDEDDHLPRLDLNNKSTTMETDLDEQHDTIMESGQHYFSSLASNLDDSMRANNPSECSRSVTINTMDDCSATTKSTVTNYRSDSSIGAPYSSTATGISGASSLRPATTTSCDNNAASGISAVSSDNNQRLKLEQHLSKETNTKQGFKSLTLLRNIVKRASFRRSSTSSSTQQQQHQSDLSQDKPSSLVTASSRNCSISMASLQLPSPEEKLVQLSDQFKPKFVPIDVDTMFMRCNSSRRSLLHADFKIKRSKSQASDHSCNDRSHRNSSRRQSKRDNKISLDDSRHHLSSHRNRGSQVAWQTLNRLKMSKSEHRVNEVSVQTEFQSNGNNATMTDSEKNSPNCRLAEDDNLKRTSRNGRPASVANCNIMVREHSSTQYDNNGDEQKQPRRQQFSTADANTNADINDAGNSSSGNWSESSPTTSESDRIKRQQKIDTINQENNKILIENNKPSATAKTIHSLPEDDLDEGQSTGGYNNHANYNENKQMSELNKRCTSVLNNGKLHHHDNTASRQSNSKHIPTNVGQNTTNKRTSTNSNRQASRNANQSQPAITANKGPQSYSTRVSPSSKQPIHIIPLVPAPPTDDEEASSVYSCDTDGFYTSMHTDCGLYRLCNETTDGINEEDDDENSDMYKGMFNDMMEAKQQVQQQNHNDKQSSPAINGLQNNRLAKKTSPSHKRQHQDHSGSSAIISQTSCSKKVDRESLEMYSSTSTLEEDKSSPGDSKSKCSLEKKAAKQQNGNKAARPPPPPPPQRKDSLSSDTREVLLQIYMQMRNLSRLDSDQIRLSDKIIKEAMDEEHKATMDTRRYSTGYNQSSAPSSIYDNHLGDQQELMSSDTNHGATNQPALRSSSQCSSSCVAPSTIMDSPSPSAGIASSSMRSVLNDLKLSSMEALTSMPSDSNESLMVRQYKQQETYSSICDDDELDNDRSHYHLSLKPPIETQAATSDKNCKQLQTLADNCNLSVLKRRSTKLPSILDQRPTIIMRKDHDVSDDKSTDNNTHTASVDKEEHVKIAYKDIEKRKNTLKAMLKSLTNRTVSFRSKTMKQTPLSHDLTAAQQPHQENDKDNSSKPNESNQKEQDATTTATVTEDDKLPVKQLESVQLKIEPTTEAQNGLSELSEQTIENIVIEVDKEIENEMEESVFDETKLNECKMRMLYPISRYQPDSTPIKTSADSCQNYKRQSNASQYENEISNGAGAGAAPTIQSNDDHFCNSNTELDPIDIFNSWQANRSGHGRDPASVRTRLSSGSLADLGLARNRNSWSGESSSSPCSSSPTTGPSSSPMSPHITVASILKQCPLNELQSNTTHSTAGKSKLQQSNLNGSVPDIDNYIDDEDDDNKEHRVNSNGSDEHEEQLKQLSSMEKNDADLLSNGIVNLAFNSNFIDEEEEDEHEQQQQQQVSFITKDNSLSSHQSKQMRDYASLSLKHCNSFQGNLTKKPNGRKSMNINGTSMFAPSCEPISEEDPEESSDNNTGSNEGNRQSL